MLCLNPQEGAGTLHFASARNITDGPTRRTFDPGLLPNQPNFVTGPSRDGVKARPPADTVVAFAAVGDGAPEKGYYPVKAIV